jgi:uncharacterized protein (UPF0335 family)
MKIEKFDNYNKGIEMAMHFFNSLDSINESKTSNKYRKVQNSEIKRLKSAVKGDIQLNFGLIASFGAGIGALYPIVDSLISLSGPSLDARTVVLLTMAGVYMIVQGEVKDANEKKEITAETKAILEELKLAGFPNVATGTKDGSDNSILNKIVKVLKSIYNIFTNIKNYIEKSGFSKMLKRATINTTSGFADMFAYTAMLAPIMNSINAVIELSPMRLDDFIANTAVFILGIVTIITKHGIRFFVSKMRNFLNLEEDEKEEIKSDLKNVNSNSSGKIPSIKNFGDFNNNDIAGQEIIQDNLRNSKVVDYILDKINAKHELTYEERDLLDKYSRGEDISDIEKKYLDGLNSEDDQKNRISNFMKYDPRKDTEMSSLFGDWSDKDIDLERLNILWNDIDEDAIEDFFKTYGIDKKDYEDDKGNLPGEIPEDLVDHFAEYLKKNNI